jgi:hypothetical protein
MSTLLAVGWKAMITSSEQEQEQEQSFLGCVQIYYRENYYWYLKQQWVEDELSFLGFDKEQTSKCYLTHLSSYSITTGEIISSRVFRIIETTWKIMSNTTRDGTVCVIDGEIIHFTPLGYHNVPPPMSMYQEKLSYWSSELKNYIVKQMCCWKFPKSLSLQEINGQSMNYGFAILMNNRHDILLGSGDSRGRIQRREIISFEFELCA